VLDFRRLAFQAEEEEDTFIRPETMLRNALMAIDPEYAKRTEYAQGSQPSRPEEEDHDSADTESPEDTQMQTQRRRRSKVDKPNGALLAMRVAVLPIPEDGDVRLLFLPPGADPPPGVATALLVPPTEEDAELLAKVYADCAAKL
jgi:hypothetical protein